MNPTDPIQPPDEHEFFGQLVEQHQAAIRAFAAARIGDPFEAHDIAQEVFLVAFGRVNEIDQARPLRPWLYQIAANLIRNHRRKRRAITLNSANDNILELVDSEIDSGGLGMRGDSLQEALAACLSRLESDARELVRLRYEEGLGISEIRATHGGKHSAMTMRLHRLREQLRLCVENRLGANHG